MGATTIKYITSLLTSHHLTAEEWIEIKQQQKHVLERNKTDEEN